MKKLLLVTCFAVFAQLVHAQGTLNILNHLSGEFRAFIYGPEPGDVGLSLAGNSSLGIPAGTTAYTGPLLAGTGFTFAVYYGAATVTDPNALTLLTTATFRTGAASGLITSQLATVVPGSVEGSTVKMQVRAWDNKGGTVTSWSDLLNDTKGNSAMFSQPLGGGVLLPPDMTGWNSFNIYQIPEPGTFVLGALGAGALLFVRRRY